MSVRRRILSTRPEQIRILLLGKHDTDTAQREKTLEDLRIAEAYSRELGTGHWLVKTQEDLARL
ncbi:hypothetical protein ACFL0Q_01935 [Thermodesulfobacteriota bacterium]